LSLFADIVKNPVFPEQELMDVKDEMRSAIRRREDDIFQFSGLAFKELLFLSHPLRLDDGGTMESIDRIRRDDIIVLYRRLAAPSNMVLSVFGDIDPEETLEKLESRFGGLAGPAVQLKSAHEDPPSQPREKEIFMDKEQAMVMTGFHGVDLKHADRYGLEVLTAILGSSFSGRLFNGIREDLGQAYSLGGYSAPAMDAGYICFYVLTAEKDIVQVQEVLRKNIKRVQEELIPAKELEDMKTYLKGTFKAGLETNAALSFTSGLDELYGLGFDYYQEYNRKIDAVTVQDLKRLASQYLDLNKSVTVITRPKKD
jgi:zinc protease